MKRYWLSISLATAGIILIIFAYEVFYTPYLDTVPSEQPVQAVDPYPIQDQPLQAPQESATGDEYDADVPGATLPDNHVIRMKREVVREDLEDHGYLATQLSVRPTDDGIVVLTLDKESLLIKAGLRVGDKIQDVNGTPVRSIKDLSRAIKEAQVRCNGPVSIERITPDGRLDPIYIKPR